MQWILIGVIVISLLVMSSIYPKVAFSVLGALTIAAVIFFYGARENGFLSGQRLLVSDVQIENAVITPAYGGSYQLNARLVNNHVSVTLKESVLSITMLDCPNGGENNCMVIGQSAERINVKIPAHQARDISVNMFFERATPSNTIRWQYKVIETRN